MHLVLGRRLEEFVPDGILISLAAAMPDGDALLLLGNRLYNWQLVLATSWESGDLFWAYQQPHRTFEGK